MAFGIYIVREVRRNVVVIEAFSVPPSVAQQGYTGEVIAVMLSDRLSAVRRVAKSYMTPQELRTASIASEAALEVPKAGVTLHSLVEFARALVGAAPIRVSGELTLGDHDVILTARVLNSPVDDIRHVEHRIFLDAPVTSTTNATRLLRVDHINELMDTAAAGILMRTQPYLLAAYVAELGDTARARDLISYVLQHGPDEERAYAHNLLGNILAEGGDEDGAQLQFQLATLAAPHLVLPYYNASHRYYLNERYLEAIPLTDSALARDPRYPLAHNLHGLLLEVQLRYPEAERAFERAVRGDPGNPLYIRNWAEMLRRRGRIEEAKLKYQEGLARAPANPLLLFGYAEVSARSNRSLALRLFEQGLQIIEREAEATGRPPGVSGYVRYANVLRGFGQDSAAVAVLQRAIDRDSASVDAHITLASFLYRIGDTKNGKEAFERAVVLDPARADTYIAWGEAHRGRGNRPAALRKFQEAVERQPSDARGYYLQASVLGDSAGDLNYFGEDEAADSLYALSNQLYEAALEVDSTSVTARLHWAHDLTAQDLHSRADSVLAAAARDNPWAPEIIATQGAVKRRAGDYKAAVGYFKRAFWADTAAFSDYAGWAFSSLMLGDYSEAARRYEQGAPDNLAAYDVNNWGVALEKLGRESEAEEKYRRAIGLDPNQADALFNLGQMLSDRGDYQEAIDLLSRALAVARSSQRDALSRALETARGRWLRQGAGEARSGGRGGAQDRTHGG